jgi:hypothetical protein
VIAGLPIRRNQVGAWGVRLLAGVMLLWSGMQASTISFAGFGPDGTLRPAAWPVVGVTIMVVGFAAWAAWRAKAIGWALARLLWPERADPQSRWLALFFGVIALCCLCRAAFDLVSLPAMLLTMDALARTSGLVADTSWFGASVALDGVLVILGTALLWIAGRFGRRVA